MKSVLNLLVDVAAPAAGPAFRTPAQHPKKAVIVNITGTSGAQTASVNIEVSNNGTQWGVLSTLSMSGTSTDTKQYIVDGPFFYVRANVTAITGTGAKVNATLAY